MESAIITAPRHVDYLTDTLASLRAADFNPSIVRDVRNDGPNSTFRGALSFLLGTTRATSLAVFQDDLQAATGLSEWLDGLQWPEPPGKVACLSLYCSGPQTRSQSGWWKLDDPYDMRGALATVWPWESAQAFLNDPPVFSGRTKTDMLIGKWAGLRGKSIWVHCPSLVQHTGEVSALSDDGLTEARMAMWFCDDVAGLDAQ